MHLLCFLKHPQVHFFLKFKGSFTLKKKMPLTIVKQTSVVWLVKHHAPQHVFSSSLNIRIAQNSCCMRDAIVFGPVGE